MAAKQSEREKQEKFTWIVTTCFPAEPQRMVIALQQYLLDKELTKFCTKPVIFTNKLGVTLIKITCSEIVAKAIARARFVVHLHMAHRDDC